MFDPSKYHFFDYKYNIEGYSGQDYNLGTRIGLIIFTIISVALIIAFAHKLNKKKMDIFFKVYAVFIVLWEAFKMSWEGYYDVTTGRGFNYGGILPIYTCSLFIYSMIMLAFFPQKVKRFAASWLSTVGVFSGISLTIFPSGPKWYPLLSFGCLYSLLFHYSMVCMGVLLIASGYLDIKFSDILRAMAVHLIFSAIVVPIDYAYGWDYMQYYSAGGVPVIEDVSSKLAAKNLRIFTVPLMILVYAALTSIFTSLYIGIKALVNLIKKEIDKKKPALVLHNVEELADDQTVESEDQK